VTGHCMPAHGFRGSVRSREHNSLPSGNWITSIVAGLRNSLSRRDCDRATKVFERRLVDAPALTDPTLSCTCSGSVSNMACCRPDFLDRCPLWTNNRQVDLDFRSAGRYYARRFSSMWRSVTDARGKLRAIRGSSAIQQQH